jgi:hypothetical protein
MFGKDFIFFFALRFYMGAVASRATATGGFF